MRDNTRILGNERELDCLRERLSEWFDDKLSDLEDAEQWAAVVLETLQSRGFVYIEKCGEDGVLSCLGCQGNVHIARAPSRPLAVARVVRQFADNACECRLLFG